MATSMQLGATASQPGAADESSEESSDDDSASEENKGKYVPWQLSSPFYGSLCWIFGEPFSYPTCRPLFCGVLFCGAPLFDDLPVFPYNCGPLYLADNGVLSAQAVWRNRSFVSHVGNTITPHRNASMLGAGNVAWLATLLISAQKVHNGML